MMEQDFSEYNTFPTKPGGLTDKEKELIFNYRLLSIEDQKEILDRVKSLPK